MQLVGAGGNICILAFPKALKMHFFCPRKGKTRALDNQYTGLFLEQPIKHKTGIRYPSVCLHLYLRRYEQSLIDSSPLPRASKKLTTFQMETERIKSILDQGNGLTLREIRDTIESKQDEVEIPNQSS